MLPSIAILSMRESRPGAVNLLHANEFSVARSNIPASCCAIDLTIEQTVNRSAKTPSGIVGFSRKPATYYKWCVTRHTRATYLQATQARANMSADCDDGHRATKPSELKKSEQNVQRVLEAFCQFLNPFDVDSELHASLFCVSSGLPIAEDVATDVVRYFTAGTKATDEFLKARLIERTIKFQDPIKKLHLKNVPINCSQGSPDDNTEEVIPGQSRTKSIGPFADVITRQ